MDLCFPGLLKIFCCENRFQIIIMVRFSKSFREVLFVLGFWKAIQAFFVYYFWCLWICGCSKL